MCSYSIINHLALSQIYVVYKSKNITTLMKATNHSVGSLMFVVRTITFQLEHGIPKKLTTCLHKQFMINLRCMR